MKIFYNSNSLKFFLRFLSILLLIFIYIIVNAQNYSNLISKDLSSKVLRLHIIANSNSDKDQKVKLLVRDNILNYMNTITNDSKTKKESIEILSNNLSSFKEIAKSTLKENNFNYSVSASIGNYKFPTKSYGDIYLPSGYYDALQIKLGNAEGKNWWCVMFPPLCFIDISSGIVPDNSKEYLKNNLTSEEYSIISDTSNINYTFKFKILELFNNNNLFTAKNNLQ